MEIDYKKYIRAGGGRADLTKLYASPEAMDSVTDAMSKPFRDLNIDKVVALDALGFVFGAMVSHKLKTGLVLMRKEGKLRINKKSISFTDYTKSEKTFEIMEDSIDTGDQVLIVDEWSETGSQLKASINLIESMGGKVVGLTCLNIDDVVLKDPDLQKYKLLSIVK